MTTSRSKGFSLPELLLVSGLFAGFLLVAYTMLNRGVAVWQKTESSQDATLRLAQGRQSIERDLRAGAFERCKVAVNDGVVGGQCLWFLSAADEQTGELARTEDGAPLWQHNILYYLARPKDHNQVFGQPCQQGAPNRCPHKFLIRRVFDMEANANKVEPLMTRVQALNRVEEPTGYDLGLEPRRSISDSLIATGMLGMALTRGVGAAPEVEILLSAFGVEDAGKKVRVGTEDLSQSSFTSYLLFSVYPGNGGG